MIDPKEFESYKTSLETLGQDMMDKNQRIYLSTIPEMANLPKPEKKIMVSQQNIPDNLNTLLESPNSSLDALVPKEVKKMMENYKYQMNEFIVENLNKYEHEAEIDAYLAKLELPHSLECVLSQAEISEFLWKKVSDIQQKGGAMFLDNHLSNLGKKNEELVKRTSDISIAVKNEEDEDSKYRSQYGSRWTRSPSNHVNGMLNQRIELILKNLSIAKECDAKIKNSIVENRKYLEILSLNKASLSKQIPVKTDPDKIKNSEPATKLRKDLDVIEGLKTKSMEVINKTFQTLNEDNIIPQFLQVLQNKTTEKSIFEDNKKRYEELMKELSSIDEEIKIVKMSILANNTTFQREMQSNSNYSEVNDKFFKDLEGYCVLYNQKLQQLQQGMKFYTDCTREIQNLSDAVNDFLRTRDAEKNNQINFILSGSGGNTSTNRNIPISNPNQLNQNQFNDNMIYDFTKANTNANNNTNININSIPNNQSKFINFNIILEYLGQSAFLDPNRNIITNINSRDNFNMDFNFSNQNQNQNQNMNMNFTNPKVNRNQNLNNNFNNQQNLPNRVNPADIFSQLDFINFNDSNNNPNNNSNFNNNTSNYNDIYRNYNNIPNKR